MVSRPANRKQRKRPRAERKCPMCERLREQLRRENERLGGEMSDILRQQEKLRAQLDAAQKELTHASIWWVSQKAGAMLDALSHALDRANEQIEELRRVWKNSFIELSAANSRIAELTAEREAEKKYAVQLEGDISEIRIENTRIVAEAKQTYDWNNKLVSEHYDLGDKIRALEAHVARLTAEKSVLDADCAKIRGERDKVVATRAIETRGAYDTGYDDAKRAFCKPKHWWQGRRSLTQILIDRRNRKRV